MLRRKTYYVTHIYPCCANCKLSYTKTPANYQLLCNNREEWEKETIVNPLGVCDSFCSKELPKGDIE